MNLYFRSVSLGNSPCRRHTSCFKKNLKEIDMGRVSIGGDLAPGMSASVLTQDTAGKLGGVELGAGAAGTLVIPGAGDTQA